MQSPTSYRRSVTLMAGVSGSGKTTFTLAYLVNVLALCRFVFDADGEFSRRLRLPPARSAQDLEKDLASGWCIFDPHGMFPGQLAGALRFFCEWTFEVSQRGPGRKILVIDEVWRYCSPFDIPQELALCLQTGRKFGLEMVFCSQRPNRLNEAILNEVSELVTFHLQAPNALRAVDMIGIKPALALSLAPGQFIALNCDTGKTLAGRVF